MIQIEQILTQNKINDVEIKKIEFDFDDQQIKINYNEIIINFDECDFLIDTDILNEYDFDYNLFQINIYEENNIYHNDVSYDEYKDIACDINDIIIIELIKLM